MTSLTLIRFLFVFTVVTFTIYGISDSFAIFEMVEVQDSCTSDDGDKSENEENEKKELDYYLTLKQKAEESNRSEFEILMDNRENHLSPTKKIHTPPPERS